MIYTGETKMNDITFILDILRSKEHLRVGECIEIAKGKYELTDSQGFKNKLKRIL